MVKISIVMWIFLTQKDPIMIPTSGSIISINGNICKVDPYSIKHWHTVMVILLMMIKVITTISLLVYWV